MAAFADNSDGTSTLMLTTDRYTLVAATPESLRAELRSPEHLASLLHVEVPIGWPPGEYDRSAQKFFLTRLENEGPASAGWYSWYLVLHESPEHMSVLIGAGGYFGPPDESGVVEIGYSIVPAYQRRGHATELVRALVDQAFADPRVSRITARTTANNPASCKVLERSGFRLVGSAEEPGSLSYALIHETWLTKGSTVRAGDVIAFTGKSGLAAAPRLHDEVIRNGTNVDPKEYPPPRTTR